MWVHWYTLRNTFCNIQCHIHLPVLDSSHVGGWDGSDKGKYIAYLRTYIASMYFNHYRGGYSSIQTSKHVDKVHCGGDCFNNYYRYLYKHLKYIYSRVKYIQYGTTDVQQNKQNGYLFWAVWSTVQSVFMMLLDIFTCQTILFTYMSDQITKGLYACICIIACLLG